MKKRNKILVAVISVVLVVATCFALTACNNTTTIKVNPDKEHYVVGICQLVQHAALDAATEGFMDALTEELAKEGRTVEFDLQNAQGDATTCSTIANKFVTNDVDLILANATAALQATSQATLSIPILGTSITDYITALELTDFNGVVGGNISGTSDLAPLETQAEMISALLPDAQRVGILYCSAEPNSEYQANTITPYMEANGLTVTKYSFSDSNDISSILSDAVTKVDVIYIPTDNTAASCTGIIDSICSNANIPVIAGEEGICTGCANTGLATLSISYYGIGYTTGVMAANILLGKSDITTLPIVYDEAPVFKYNPEACERFGVTVPDGYVAFDAE